MRASDARPAVPAALGAEGSCTIGGNLSTQCGGRPPCVWVAREMSLGLEVVLPTDVC